MDSEKINNLHEVVSATVLSAIKGIYGKQPNKKPIGIDSISLVLNVKLIDLVPIIEGLNKKGEILIHRNTASYKKRKADSVSVI